MPNNLKSQKGFVETLALLGIGLILLTIPLAQKLASERQEVRNYAQEQPECATNNKCPGASDPSPIQQCYSWAGSGCVWNGSSCGCKASVPQAPAPAVQQPSSGEQLCKSVGQTCKEEKYPEACKTTDGKDGTKICHKEGTCEGIGGPEKCSFGQGSYCGECTTGQPTLPKEAPVAATPYPNQVSPGPCGGNFGNSCPKDTTCSCIYLNGAWHVNPSGQVGFDACCKNNAPAQPAANGTGFFCEGGNSVTKVNGVATKTDICPTTTGCDQLTGKCKGATANRCLANNRYDGELYDGATLVCCTAGVEIACASKSAPVQPASTNRCYTNSKYDGELYDGATLVCCTAGVEVACASKSAPAVPAQPAFTNKCYTNSKYDEDFYVGSTLVCCTAGVEVACASKSAPAAPAANTQTKVYSCVKDSGVYYIRETEYGTNNMLSEKPCSYGCSETSNSFTPIQCNNPAPAAPAVQTDTCKSFSCKDPEPNGTYKPYYYKYYTEDGSYQGPYTDCTFTERFDLSKQCPEFAPAILAPAAPATNINNCNSFKFDCPNGSSFTLIINDTDILFKSDNDCKNNLHNLTEDQFNNYYDSQCSSAPAEPPVDTKCDVPGVNAYFEDHDGIETKVCCKDNKKVLCPEPPAPAQPATEQENTVYLPTIQTGETTNQEQPNPQPETFKPILCSMTKCSQSDKTYFINCTATGDCTTYNNYPCVNATLLSDLNTYCSEPPAQEPITNTPPKPATSTTRSFSGLVSNAICGLQPISFICHLLGYVPY